MVSKDHRDRPDSLAQLEIRDQLAMLELKDLTDSRETPDTQGKPESRA
jgi:hypothetical protein